MKKLLSFGAMVLAMTLGSSLAQAQFVLNPAFTYSTSKTEGATVGGTSESSLLSLDLHAGFLMPSGLFLGGFYGYATSGDGTNDVTFSSPAPTVGYFADGFLALLSYHFMAVQETGPTSELTEGAGPQVDIGYVLPVTGSFSIGPQFRWRSIDFGKLKTGAVEIDADAKFTELNPMISLWFQF